MAATTIAYCFASGHIQFGPSVPDGAIGIAKGEAQKVRDVIEVTARLSVYDNETLFVPGIPEAASQRDGMVALARYIQFLGERNGPGFRAMGA
ncbi:host nuclease inhibitor protein [Pseudomonas sp. F(2018)]|uniref:host nuclease inhibitor protein n=1 Tax=Pseudomonas sp. F(2018) TaxID=2502240 RepID=UPI0010F6A8A5|nr:host nuclease inhibitor protein [Pseudomonas sp. F(2018)]